jgi:hypothetical protein
MSDRLNYQVTPAVDNADWRIAMFLSSRFSYLTIAFAASAMLAGCSGTSVPGSQQIDAPPLVLQQRTHAHNRGAVAPSRLPPTRSEAAPEKAFFSPALTGNGPKRFFSDFALNAVYVYGGGKHVGTLTGFNNPSGLATDASGNLYVANEGAANILVFAPPYNTTPTTLDDPGQYPADVAVDSQGNVAACNLYSNSVAGNVAFYPAGSTSSTNTLSSASLGEVYFCAFDANGNLYLDGIDSTYSYFVAGEVVGGINGTGIATLTTSNTILYPGGVQVTTGGQIAFMDQGPGSAIYTYNPPVSGSLGSPVTTTPLSGAGDPVGFAFGKPMTSVTTADAGLVAAVKYAYPAGGAALHTKQLRRGGLPIGVATIPTEQY